VSSLGRGCRSRGDGRLAAVNWTDSVVQIAPPQPKILPLFHPPISGKITTMNPARYVHWQDGEMWLGYFEEFPDYLTQGDSLEDLEEHLRDLHRDLTSGAI